MLPHSRGFTGFVIGFSAFREEDGELLTVIIRHALPRIWLAGLLAAPIAAMAAEPATVPGSDLAAAARRLASEVPVDVGPDRELWQQVGLASWYGGPRWQGHMTASGRRYDENALTAAHATLPIGTRIRVTVVGTNTSVIVTINDRPSTHSRIIDLSRAAARSLGILARGIAKVSLSRVEA